MQYREWLRDWLEHYVKPTTKEKTYLMYAEAVRLHIAPRFGAEDAGAITPLALQRFVTDLLEHGNHRTGGGLSPNTVNTVITVVQRSLSTACSLGLIREYTADRVKRPKVPQSRVSCFTAAEQKQIERAVRGDRREKMIGVILCLYTGLRIGELLALEWTDIDLANATLSVTKTCHDGKDANGKYLRVINPPKTESSIRDLPLPRQIIPLLRAIKQNSRSPFVIASGFAVPSVRSYQRSFELLLCRLKLPHRGFHALRHTFATRALETGMDIKTLSEILGHNNPTVTLKRYAHSLLPHKQEQMNRLGRLLI